MVGTRTRCERTVGRAFSPQNLVGVLAGCPNVQGVFSRDAGWAVPPGYGPLPASSIPDTSTLLFAAATRNQPPE